MPPADPAAIAAAVTRLAAMSPQERQARAWASRGFCERRYDIRMLNPRMLAQAMGARGTEPASEDTPGMFTELPAPRQCA